MPREAVFLALAILAVSFAQSGAADVKTGAPEGDRRPGRVLFEQECAGCHGEDASGDAGADIRGMTAWNIRWALNGVDDMGGIELGSAEIAALAAYLGPLGE